MKKPIKDFECYLIDEHGNIYSRLTGKILYQDVNKKGYLKVALWRNGLRHWKLVHRLVASHFPRPNSFWDGLYLDLEGLEVHHLDRDRKNNYYLNLLPQTRYEHRENFHPEIHKPYIEIETPF